MTFKIFMPKWYRVLRETKSGSVCWHISRKLKVSLENIYGTLHVLENANLIKRKKVLNQRGRGHWEYMWYATVQGRQVIAVMEGIDYGF